MRIILNMLWFIFTFFVMLVIWFCVMVGLIAEVVIDFIEWVLFNCKKWVIAIIDWVRGRYND